MPKLSEKITIHVPTEGLACSDRGAIAPSSPLRVPSLDAIDLIALGLKQTLHNIVHHVNTFKPM